MRVEKFDFRRLYDAWDDALIGRKCLISDSLDDIFDYMDNGMDWCCNEPEIVEKHDERYADFRSVHNGNSYRYAYVLDEDFVEEPLAEVRWFREDIRNSIACNLARVVTKSDIRQVIDNVNWRRVEDVMIEHGWDVIDTAVAEYIRGGRKCT